MLENEFHISKLIAGHFRSQLTADEAQELELWIGSSTRNKEYFDQLQQEDYVPYQLKEFDLLSTSVKDDIWDKALDTLGPSFRVPVAVDKKRNFYILWPRIAVAAAIVLIIGAVAVILNLFQDPNAKNNQTTYASDVPAGISAATLTLANGRKIRLTDAIKGELAKEAGVTITKTKDGQVVYTILASPGEIASQARNDGILHNDENQVFNTLSTSRGEMYQIVLPDKSIVWLNAASSLKYPASFANLKERKVILDGEAYFQVTHNAKQPFRVQTRGQLIEDVGTSFNVNSYIDEADTRTTLVEGSVKISLPGEIASEATQPRNDGKQARNDGKRARNDELTSIILRPGDQAVLTKNKLIVQPADMESTLAWKEGYFLLDTDDFKGLMNKISRWYNVEVIYEIAPESLKLGGRISRNQKISAVLKAMERTGEVHFKVEGRRITVID